MSSIPAKQIRKIRGRKTTVYLPCPKVNDPLAVPLEGRVFEALGLLAPVERQRLSLQATIAHFGRGSTVGHFTVMVRAPPDTVVPPASPQAPASKRSKNECGALEGEAEPEALVGDVIKWWELNDSVVKVRAISAAEEMKDAFTVLLYKQIE